MSTLHLSLKGEYFDAIKAGMKPEEYRLTTPYWRKRLEGRSYSQIVLTKGYPAADDAARRLTLPWRGYTVKTIQHAFFGPQPVEVFAIDVSGVKVDVVDHTEDMLRMARRWHSGLETDDSLRAYFRLFNPSASGVIAVDGSKA